MPSRLRLLAAGLATALALGLGATASHAQQAGDDALEKLLEQVDDPGKPPGVTTPDNPQLPAGEVTDTDKGLDRLLEKLGETEDAPETRGPTKPRPGAQPPMPGPGPQPDQPPPSDAGLKGQDQGLDRHLEELLGRKKRNPQDPQGGDAGQDSGPLADAIKKMEEARKRLSDSDTGESTRKTQGEIVRELDTILEQLKKSSSSSSSSRQQRLANRIQQAGSQGQKPQPGNQPGQNPNPDGPGTGAQAPRKPTVGEVLAGQKDTWGDLPPHLREEMENVFREEMLPAKRDLIIRYYSSVARKGRSGGQ